MAEQHRMASLTTLTIFLVLLISGTQGEEEPSVEIRTKGEGISFPSWDNSDFCVISRYVGEEHQVLWNTSDLSPGNSTLPEDLRNRLTVNPGPYSTFYRLVNVSESDSGTYKTECWTNSTQTYQDDINHVICSNHAEQTVWGMHGKAVALFCEETGKGDHTRVSTCLVGMVT